MMRHRIDVVPDAGRTYELNFVDDRGHAITAEPMYEFGKTKLYIGVPKSPVVWKYGMPLEMPMMSDQDGVFLEALGWKRGDRNAFRRVTMYFVQLNNLDWDGKYEAILSLPCESDHVLVLANYRASSLKKGGSDLKRTRANSAVKVFGKMEVEDSQLQTPYMDFAVVRLTEAAKIVFRNEQNRMMAKIANQTKRWDGKMAAFYRGREEVAWQMNELSPRLHEYGWRTVFYKNSMDVVVQRGEEETAFNFRFAEEYLCIMEDLVKRGDEALEPAFWTDDVKGSFPMLQGKPAVSWYRS